ncbi:MAG: hypothetical protein GX163_04520 [Bacteroidetes bacterium]|nr:hypothetical protein [Bacteroidota bacterium]
MDVANKSNHYLLTTGKVIVLSVILGYLIYRFDKVGVYDWHSYKTHFNENFLLLLFIGSGIFTAVNWFLEIFKWKELAETLRTISYKTAFKQTLAAFSVAVITPARIGEYGLKAFYFKPAERKKVFLLTLFSNVSQMVVTLIFGCFGLVFFLSENQVFFLKQRGLLILILLLPAVIIGYLFRRKTIFIKGFTLQNCFEFFIKLSIVTIAKVFLFSVLRYVIFSSMFYFLLLFFGMELPVTTAFLLIFTMYLLVSMLPTFLIFDVVIRGGVAVWLFAFYGVSEWIVISTVSVMWIYNFLIPALLGSFFIAKFKPVS